MKKFNYYYNGQPITKSEFLKHVPENWEDNVNEYGEYSWGYYRASEIFFVDVTIFPCIA